ncbi:tyrosine-protein phosphatase Lar [Thrips palmi]|uniref:protein-tyrosine-phosphatase n=1 Tax=Thrips palmi TaxID=161013 RepID=A0A6P9A0I6_THRPL|nr:tyrosine-protein phosphatase Lar [Thrips palmi]
MKMRRLLQALSLLLLLSCCHANLNSGSGVFKFIKYLNHPPEITVRPRPQVVRAGGVAFFLCAAKGDPPPLLRWRRRSRSGAAAAAALTERAKVLRLPGPPGPPVGGKVASAAAGGARLLRIQNVQPRDGAIFVCVAENSAGDAVSAEAQLTVLDGKGLPGFPVVSPAISDSLTSRVVEAGHSVVLPCSATGNPLPTIAWLKDGVPLQALHKLGGRVAVINAPGPSGSLNVSAAKESDQGRYECVAENTVGSQFSAPIQLYVKVRRVQPYFTLPAPAEVEVQIGAHINLTCAASGTPMPRLRWHLSKDYAMLNDRRMDWPMADQPQEDQDYQDEEDNELLLVPEHVPMNTEEQETSTHRPDRADGTLGAASVVLNNIKENLNYTCVATSALGVIHSTTRIRVQTLPGPPLALRAYDVTATSARLSWRSPADEPREYALQFRVKGSAAARGFTKGSGVGVAGGIFQEVKGVSSLHYTLRGLTANTKYEVRVVAVNALGRGPHSEPLAFTTLHAEDSPFDVPQTEEAPRGLQVRPLSSTTLLVQWDEPPSPSGPVSGYRVYFTTHPLLPLPLWSQQSVDDSRLSTVSGLTPHQVYWVRVQALTAVGAGPPSVPALVKTQQGVPGSPNKFRLASVSSSWARLEWSPPSPLAEDIVSYELYWNDTYSRERHHLSLSPGSRGALLETLYPGSMYVAWVAARSPRGEGAPTTPLAVRTQPLVLPAPKDIKTWPINTTAIRLEWKPPTAGANLTRGFVVLLESNQEDAVPVEVERSPAPPLEVTWLMPPQSATPVIGYRLLYGPVGDPAPKELLKNAADQRAILDDLERGVQYEFRMAGRTQAGWGQDARLTMWMPEGRPSGPPTNVTVYWQAAGVLAVTWDPPETLERGGNVTVYTASVTKAGDYSGSSPTVIFARNVSAINPKAVFAGLEDGVDVDVQVQAHTSQGAGPASPKLTVRVPPSPARAPLKVGAAATSQHSMEVWWEPLPVRGKLLGYQVLYTTTAVEDLDEWQSLSVGLTESVELVGLERLAEYAVTVAARTREGLGHLSSALTVRVRPTEVPVDLRASDVSTHGLTLKWGPAIQINPLHYRLSWDAVKLFVDAQGITQTQLMPRRDLQLDKAQRMYQLTQLQPFTTYRVNLTAVPADRAYRPPATLIVTTQMAAPQPMVQPALYGVVFGKEIQVILPQASEQYGPISHYYLVVVPEPMPVVEAPERPDRQDAPPVPVPAYSPPIPDTLLTSHLERASLEEREAPLRPYIAASFPQRNIPYTFHLGNNETYDGFRNKPLRSTARYRIFIRAVVDTPQKHLYTSSPYSEPLSLSMRAVPPGAAPRRPDPSVPVERQGGVAVRGGARARLGSPGLMWLVGPLGAALLLCILMVALYVVRRKRRPAKAPDAEPDGPATRPLIANQGVDGQASVSHAHSPVASDPVRVRRQNCQTAAMQAHPPVPVASLAEHMRALRDAGGISQEYESIEPGQTFTWDHSSLEVNRGKNRYANVVAYDHSRVVLNGDEPGADYINANFCDGYRQRDAYVATQGPMPNTFADFWRMVWQLGATTIAMVTRLEERTRVKCHQYWPERGSEQYGQCQVTAVLHQELAHYTLRTFSIRQEGCPPREVRHLQFTSWPDHGVPPYPGPFLLFLRRLRGLRLQGSAGVLPPLVVHCSAGVGRTGCLIVVDAMLERMLHENTVDVYGHVTCLRSQRNYMVQTEEQYSFIHDALLEAVQCGHSEVLARDLQTKLEGLETPVHGPDGTLVTPMDLEFKRLNAMRLPDATFSSASMEANRGKNRLAHAVPYDHARVILSGMGGEPGADYINASFLDGYRSRNAYIATQGPLPNTVSQFWRMVWQHNVAIIVMLTKLKEQGQDKCTQYWPAERALRYGAVLVEPLAEYNLPTYTLREFKVSDDVESRTIRQFHLSDWPGDALIDFIGQVHKTKQQFGQDGPITVHCSGGVGRSGVFIALALLLERMQYEGMVDVLGTVRLLRSQRPSMVSTLEQYHLLYQSSLQYLGSFDHYGS